MQKLRLAKELGLAKRIIPLYKDMVLHEHISWQPKQFKSHRSIKSKKNIPLVIEPNEPNDDINECPKNEAEIRTSHLSVPKKANRIISLEKSKNGNYSSGSVNY